MIQSSSRSFKRSRVPTLDTNVSDRPPAYIDSPTAPTPSPLTPKSVATVFTDASLECDRLPCPSEPENSNNMEYEDADFERIAREIIEAQPIDISTISDDTKLQDMSMDQVAKRVHEITGLIGRTKQVEAIHIVGCLRQSLILLARTSFGKSLIFNVLPLLHPSKTSVILIVMPLKLISEQQVNRVKDYNRGRPFVYDVDHNSRRDRLSIAAGCYTHVYISPEYTLSPEFTQDVVSNMGFRKRLAAVVVDELHFVHDWNRFRTKYTELHVLRARLPPAIPFLGLTATLDSKALKVVQETGGFEICQVLKTPINRPEISMHVVFMEGNQNNFEDLRRFFPETATEPYSIPKTVFFFDSKSNIQRFFQCVTELWFPSWGYCLGARKWIEAYHSDMADYDKKAIMNVFEKPDNPESPHLGSIIRFLAASEAFGAGANVPDIENVVQVGIPQSRNADAQRKGRCARAISRGFYYLVVPRWASQRADVKKTRKGHTRNPLIEAVILGQVDSDSEHSDANNERINPQSHGATNAANAQKRDKEIPEYIELINAKCLRETELKRYEDIEYLEGNVPRSNPCCSACSPGYIPKYRPYPVQNTSDSLFTAYLDKKLRGWREEKAKSLYANSRFPMPGSAVLSDRYMKIIIGYAESIQDEATLTRFCAGWTERETYKDDILAICRGLLHPNMRRTNSEAWKCWRLAVDAKKNKNNQASQSVESTWSPEEVRMQQHRKAKEEWLAQHGIVNPQKPARGGKKKVQGQNPERAGPSSLGVIETLLTPSQASQSVPSSLSQEMMYDSFDSQGSQSILQSSIARAVLSDISTNISRPGSGQPNRKT